MARITVIAACRLGAQHSLWIALYAAPVMAVIGSFKVLGAAFLVYAGNPLIKRYGLAAATLCAALTGLAAGYGAGTAKAKATTLAATTPLVDLDQIFGWPSGTSLVVAAGRNACPPQHYVSPLAARPWGRI